MKNEILQRHREIIRLWKKTRLVHPSLQEIASQVGVSKQIVHKVVHRYMDKHGIKDYKN